MIYPSQERAAHVSADLWRHLYQAQSELERQGAPELTRTLPALFAMYHCAAEAVMRLTPEELTDLRREFEDNVENLVQEAYITPQQQREMISLAGRTAEEIARQLREEQTLPQPNPIRALVKGTTRILALDRGEVNRALASGLTDFMVMGTVHRKGGASSRAHRHETKDTPED